MLLRYWQPLVLIAAVLITYGYGYLQGMNSVHREVERLKAKQIVRNIEINNEVSNEYQKTMAGLRKRHADFVRMYADSLRVNAPGRPDGCAGADGLHGRVSETFTLMLQADIQAQQLLRLQEWVNQMR